MENYLSYLILMCLSSKGTCTQDNGRQYEVLEGLQSWHDAAAKCYLARPSLAFDNITGLANLRATDKAQIISDTKPADFPLWIGYFRSYQAFQYLGCAHTSKLPPTVGAQMVEGGAGNCFKHCNYSSNFGLTQPSETKVVCLCIGTDSGLFKNETGCQAGCPEVFTSCGNADGSFVSVYKSISGNTAYGNISSRCQDFIHTRRYLVPDNKREMTENNLCQTELILCLDLFSSTFNSKKMFEKTRSANRSTSEVLTKCNGTVPACLHLSSPGRKTLSWACCNVYFNGLCQNKDGNISIKLMSNPWNKANSLCMGDQLKPARIRNVLNHSFPDSTAQAWTGVLRSKVIFGNTDTSSIDDIAYAYLYRNGASYRIGFDNNKEAVPRALCEIRHRSSTSPRISYEVTSITTISSSEIITSAVSSTIVAGDDGLKSNVTSNMDNSSTTGVAAGVSVAIIVAIGVVVGVVVLTKRGIIFTTKSVRRNDKGMAHPDISSPSTLTSTTNTSFNDIVQKGSECTPGTQHDYFVLEKQYGDENGFIKANEETGNSDYNIYHKIDDGADYTHIDQENTTDGDYNIADAHITKPVEHPKSGNVYNKVNINTGGDYDHIDGRVETSKATSENEYDTTSAANLNGSVSNGSYGTTDTKNDNPYNHLNDTRLKRSTPDNTYGNPVLEDKDGDYGSTSNAEAGGSFSYDKVNTKW